MTSLRVDGVLRACFPGQGQASFFYPSCLSSCEDKPFFFLCVTFLRADGVPALASLGGDKLLSSTSPTCPRARISLFPFLRDFPPCGRGPACLLPWAGTSFFLLSLLLASSGEDKPFSFFAYFLGRGQALRSSMRIEFSCSSGEDQARLLLGQG